MDSLAFQSVSTGPPYKAARSASEAPKYVEQIAGFSVPVKSTTRSTLPASSECV
jgi:hypothetical protein